MEKQRAKLIKNLLSYIPVRRGNWILQVSVFKNNQVLLVYKHYYDEDKFGIKAFTNHDTAIDFIEYLLNKDEL